MSTRGAKKEPKTMESTRARNHPVVSIPAPAKSVCFLPDPDRAKKAKSGRKYQRTSVERRIVVPAIANATANATTPNAEPKATAYPMEMWRSDGYRGRYRHAKRC